MRPWILAAAITACGPSASDPTTTGAPAADTSSSTGAPLPTTGSGNTTAIADDGSDTSDTGAGSTDASDTGAPVTGDSSGEDPSAGTSTTSTSCGADPDPGDFEETTTTDPTSATGVDTEDPPDGFGCEGALWFTVVASGQVNGLGLDSRGHAIGFGSHYSTPSQGYENMLIVDVDPAGAIVRAFEPKSPWQDWYAAGGVDGDDNVYAITDYSELQKFTVDGVKVGEVDLPDQGLDYYSALSVAQGGDLTIGHDDQLARRCSNLSLQWQRTSDVSLYAANDAGLILGRRWPDIALLDANGDPVWELEWSHFGTYELAINSSGQIAVGDRTNEITSVIARYTPDGELLWETIFDTPGDFDNIYDVAIDTAGNIAAVGNTQGNGGHGFVVRLDPDGNIIAQHTCPPDQDIVLSHITLDDDGNLRVAGKFDSDLGYYWFIAAY